MNFNYTKAGMGRRQQRPSAAQIVSAWKRAGKPDSFTVEYGETFAEFTAVSNWATSKKRWLDSGNGCRGVDRGAVVKLLEAA
jgi:hypothetical protein